MSPFLFTLIMLAGGSVVAALWAGFIIGTRKLYRILREQFKKAAAAGTALILVVATATGGSSEQQQAVEQQRQALEAQGHKVEVLTFSEAEAQELLAAAQAEGLPVENPGSGSPDPAEQIYVIQGDDDVLEQLTQENDGQPTQAESDGLVYGIEGIDY